MAIRPDGSIAQTEICIAANPETAAKIARATKIHSM
jgi:hypothetical protein